MRVGVAGLGRMGAPMARRLIAAGHQVGVWTRDGAKAADFAATHGAARAATPAALAQASEVVIVMLADDRASEAVHLGPDGLFRGAAPGTVLLETGTMSPDHLAALRQAAPEGVRVIDVPVSGATQAATEGQLVLMAGCTEAEAAPLAPVLDVLGRRVMCLGTRGAGAVMKLAVNALLHGVNQAFSEAMALAEAGGIDRGAAFDVFEDSAAGAPMLRYRRPLYLDEAAHPVSFTVALARKDMEVALAVAGAHGIGMPQTALALDRLRQAEAAGYGPRDMAAMLEFAGKDRA